MDYITATLAQWVWLIDVCSSATGLCGTNWNGRPSNDIFAAEEWIENLEVKYMYIVCCSELCVQCV